MSVRLSEELVDLVESGVSISVATRDAHLRPECQRVLGVEVGADRQSLTLLVNGALAGRMRANLEDNGHVAIIFSRIADHRAIQLKGTLRSMREGGAHEGAVQQRYLAAFGEQTAPVGLPRAVIRNIHVTPCLALDITIEALFLQTPGPEAGRRLEVER
jgi:hypothetical protein